MRQIWWALAVALALTGCPDDDSHSEPPVDAALTDGQLRVDEGVGGQGGGGAAGEGGAGGQVALDAGPDAEPLDQGTPRDMFAGTAIDTCQQACDRYADCERLTEVFGDEDACLTRCARLTSGGQTPDSWWSCLEVEACNLIQRCRIPDIEPLACPEVCTRAAECGVDLPDCEGACGEAGEAFQLCGEHLLEACNANTFITCLGEQVYTACDRTCAAGVGCNIIRPAGCLLDCVVGLADPDPLFSLRANDRNQCIQRANDDCAAVDGCFNPPRPGEDPLATPERFCALYDGCFFDQVFGPCFDALGGLGIDLACGIDQLANGCPDPGALINACQGFNPQLTLCNRLCGAERVCDLLGADPLALPNCVASCTGGENADPDETERAAAALGCVVADRCPDLVECLDQTGPAVECREHCAALAGCGLGGADCEDACDAAWARDRHGAYRECVAGAADCAGVSACELPPSAPCADFCVPAAACGQEDPNRCEARCDDAHFVDPNGRLLYTACVIAAPACEAANADDLGVSNCGGRPEIGLACLGYCRFSTECGGEGDLADCLRQCGRGFVGEDGLRFVSSRECLRGLAVDAACGDLDACIPNDLDVDCPAFCDRAAGCGVNLPDCEAACARDPLSRLRTLQQAGCLEAAGNDCEAVHHCLVPEAAPLEIPVDLAQLCADWNGCQLDQQFGPCPEALDGFGAGPPALRCIRDLLDNQCPPAIDAIFACLQPAPGGPIAAECATLCEARAFCNHPEAADQTECRRACEAQLGRNGADAMARVAPQLACADAWSCRVLDTCLAGSTPQAICTDHCARRAECGENINEGACVAACDRDFARLRQLEFRGCVEGAADCAAVQACEVDVTVPCEAACALQAECGGVAADCASACDDEHFRDPVSGALQVACILDADTCDGESGVNACLADPRMGARACLGYCRAVTECVPGQEAGLIECLNDCAGGFRDRNGLRFAAARECLLGVRPDAQCRVAQFCTSGAIAVDCAAYCAELGACRVPDPDCAAACANGEISLDQGGCVADARRVGDCGAVAECVGHVPPPAGAACVSACDLRADCDRALDPYLCRLDCTPTPAALPVQVACADVVGCGDQLDACFALPADIDPGCLAACGGIGACGGLFADVNACAATCTGQILSGLTLPGWADEIDACLGAAIVEGRCDEAAARLCFQVGVPLGPNFAFGHHGACDTWNGCEDAVTCANAACHFYGHGDAIAWEEGLCDDLAAQIPGGMHCSLFAELPAGLDEGWGGGCNIPVAYDVVCRP